MESSIRQTSHVRPSGGKLVMALVFASLIGTLSISPAHARDGDGRGWQQGRDRGGEHDRGRRHDNREWRGERGERGGYYGYRPEYRQPYVYAQPVYVPPPVYYQPRQSPGISLFFPLDLRR
jgi:hypothetical protein